MNFYLDFEATQPSERIISIGCVAENGETFNRFVKPGKDVEVTEYITKLTGITNEMLDEHGLTADDAFLQFYNFVESNNDEGAPTFYCYGSADKSFIKHTVDNMKNFQAIIFASSVQALLVDYSKVVKSYFSTNGLALKKLAALVRHVDEVDQIHDAMDDALMLKECFEGLDTVAKDAVDSVKKNTSANTNKPIIEFHGINYTQEQKNYFAEVRRNWTGQSREALIGDATEENYQVKITNKKRGFVKYFSSIGVAAMYFNHFYRSGRSARKVKDINTTSKEMVRIPESYCGFTCEFNICENNTVQN